MLSTEELNAIIHAPQDALEALKDPEFDAPQEGDENQHHQPTPTRATMRARRSVPADFEFLPCDSPSTDSSIDSRVSCRSTTPDQIRNIIQESTTAVSFPIQHGAITWQITAMTKAIKDQGYTAKTRDITSLILKFFHEHCSFCATDTPKALKEWGQPHATSISNHMDYYADQQIQACKRPKLWGKCVNAIFHKMAVCLWPNTHKRSKPKMLLKDRCLYGFKITQHLPVWRTNHKTQKGGPRFKTPSPHLEHSSSETSPQSEHSSSDTSPEMSTFSTPRSLGFPTPKTRKRTSTDTAWTPNGQLTARRRTNFTPYYDILHNDAIYVVRIFLPLMEPTTVEGLTMNINLGHRKLSIGGSYFPSNLIGIESARKADLRQPLLPIIYSARIHNGQFQLDIALPSDIKDNESAIQTTHDCWGLLVTLPRRKITHEAEIQLTTCFGSAKVTTGTRQSNTTLDIPPRTPRAPSLEPEPELDPNTPTTPPPAIAQSDPKSLLGLVLTISGDKWGDQWKGRQYKGTITRFYRSKKDQHIFFIAQFEDVSEKLWLNELLSGKHISQEHYDLLKPTCNVQPNQ